MSASSNLTPLGNRIIRKVFRPIVRGIFHLLARVELTGTENIPTDCAYIILFNHVSIYDPPFVGAFWPIAPEALGAEEIWSRPGQRVLAKLYGGIPIHRGEVDRDALHRVIALLQTGRPLLMSPEGTRSHHPGMGIAKSGVVYIIEKTKVPIIPVGVVGTTDDFIQRSFKGLRPVLQMKIGKPYQLPQWNGSDAAPKAIRQWQIDQIMLRIADELPEEYRGIYTDPAAFIFPKVEGQ